MRGDSYDDFPNEMGARRKYFYPSLRRPPKNEMYGKTNYLTINFVHLTHSAGRPLPITVTLSIFTVSAFIFLTLTPNIPILFTAIPQHIISPIDCTGYTRLLKTLHDHFWWDVLPCHYDPCWPNTTFIFLVYKLTWTHEEDAQFSPQMVLVVLRIWNVCVLDLCVVSVVWSVRVHGSFMAWLVESNIPLFADDCILYRRIRDSRDINILQDDLNRLMEWALVNEMRINPRKSKAVSFTKTRVKEKLTYHLGDQLIPEENNFKYLGLIIRSDLNWTDHVNHTLRKAWKALHFTMRILKKGNSNVKRLAYTALVRPILEYGSACWDPYRGGQVRALNRVQIRAAKIAKLKNDRGWETLGQRRMIARLCALFKAYTGEPAWRAIGDRLLRPCYLGRDDHNYKIRTRKQRTDVGKFSFTNRTINNWNQLPVELLASYPCNLKSFRKRVKRAIINNGAHTGLEPK